MSIRDRVASLPGLGSVVSSRPAIAPSAARLEQILTTLGERPTSDVERDADRVAQLIADGGSEVAWLTLAVLDGVYPLDADVVAFGRLVRLHGPSALSRPPRGRDEAPPADVEIVTDAVVVDLDHTSRTDLATGIQRVARETSARWDRDHDIIPVGWAEEFTGLRRLLPHEAARALGHDPLPEPPQSRQPILVPWNCTVVTPELAAEEFRTARFAGLTRHSPNRTGLIGFDCVPVTSSETSADGMGGAFAGMLASARHVDTIACISEAAGTEHRGWKDMLASVGIDGPSIEVVSLPIDRRRPTPEVVEEARLRYGMGRMPMVLCVGSHEPRKNHAAVLHAAELLWRNGREFCLLFVGGNSWMSDGFQVRLAQLKGAGRYVDSVSGIDDDELWALYEIARLMVFPSLNEGYGLPVAEALAVGTPVVTSGFGSMAEIAHGGGAVTVDPRDDHAVAEAIESILVDDALHDRLSNEASTRQLRTWDDYAAEVWAVLVEGKRP